MNLHLSLVFYLSLRVFHVIFLYRNMQLLSVQNPLAQPAQIPPTGFYTLCMRSL